MRMVFRLRAVILAVFFCGIYGQAAETGSSSYVTKDGVYKYADLANRKTNYILDEYLSQLSRYYYMRYDYEEATEKYITDYRKNPLYFQCRMEKRQQKSEGNV